MPYVEWTKEDVRLLDVFTPVLVGRMACVGVVGLLLCGQVKHELGVSSALEIILIAMCAMASPPAFQWLMDWIQKERSRLAEQPLERNEVIEDDDLQSETSLSISSDEGSEDFFNV